MTDACITVAIPVNRHGPAIVPILEALDKLQDRQCVKELWLIGNREDPTRQVAEEYAPRSGYRIRFVHLPTTQWVEKKNEALRAATTPYVLLMHADSLVLTENSYANFLAAFEGRPDVVVASAILTNPKWAYDRYGFWEKCMLARGIGIDGPSHMGNFNLFDRELLTKRVGLFDPDFSSAGDDNDMRIRIVRSGLKMAVTENRIVHLHPVAAADTCRCVLNRERVCSESYGKFLRKHGLRGYESPLSFLFAFFRPALLLALLVPYLRFAAAAAIVSYAFLYTGLVFREEWRDRRILVLPFLNVYLLLSGTFYTLRGFFGYRPASRQAKPDR